MKKTIEKLIEKLQENSDGIFIGGFRSIRGGATNTDTCNNSGTCSGLNSAGCTNSGDCSKSTNASTPYGCHNSKTCFIM
jgi:hypothetical protein